MDTRTTKIDYTPIHIEIDRESEIYKKAVAAGFSFGPIYASIVDDSFKCGDNREIHLSAEFTCVCGKKEYLHTILWPVYGNFHYAMNLRRLDIAKMLESAGAFSEDHLRKDGYSEQAILEIRKHFV